MSRPYTYKFHCQKTGNVTTFSKLGLEGWSAKQVLARACSGIPTVLTCDCDNDTKGNPYAPRFMHERWCEVDKMPRRSVVQRRMGEEETAPPNCGCPKCKEVKQDCAWLDIGESYFFKIDGGPLGQSVVKAENMAGDGNSHWFNLMRQPDGGHYVCLDGNEPQYQSIRMVCRQCTESFVEGAHHNCPERQCATEFGMPGAVHPLTHPPTFSLPNKGTTEYWNEQYRIVAGSDGTVEIGLNPFKDDKAPFRHIEFAAPPKPPLLVVCPCEKEQSQMCARGRWACECVPKSVEGRDNLLRLGRLSEFNKPCKWSGHGGVLDPNRRVGLKGEEATIQYHDDPVTEEQVSTAALAKAAAEACDRLMENADKNARPLASESIATYKKALDILAESGADAFVHPLSEKLFERYMEGMGACIEPGPRIDKNKAEACSFDEMLGDITARRLGAGGRPCVADLQQFGVDQARDRKKMGKSNYYDSPEVDEWGT